MLRYEDLDKISDGRLYHIDDKVKVGTNGCAGCSKCCESDMGNTIVLTPYDIFSMTRGSGKTFDELLTNFYIELSMVDGLVLPNLKMDKGCQFLKDGRCSIHSFRPGICRLFPLGRIYNEKGFDYILQTGECPVKDKSEVTVREWLGIDDITRNDAFINKWHRFLIFERKKVSLIREMAEHEAKRILDISESDLETYAGIIKETDALEQIKEAGHESDYISAYRKDKAERIRQQAETDVKEVMKTVLRMMYMEGYDFESDFYAQFDERLKKCFGVIRKYN